MWFLSTSLWWSSLRRFNALGKVRGACTVNDGWVLCAYYRHNVPLKNETASCTSQNQLMKFGRDGNLDTERVLLKQVKVEAEHERRACSRSVQTVRRPGGESKDNLRGKKSKWERFRVARTSEKGTGGEGMRTRERMSRFLYHYYTSIPPQAKHLRWSDRRTVVCFTPQ